jgi:hypothetical protein
MGEPLPGDIPDPIYLKTTNVTLTATQIVSRGDFLEAFDNTNWQAISTTSVQFVNGKIVQSQEAQDSTGFSAGEINLAAFGVGSWIYALAGEVLGSEDPVRLCVYFNGTINRIGFCNKITVALDTSIQGTAIGEVTVINTVDRGVRVGDQITVTNTTNYNFTFNVTDVSTDGLTITMFATASTDTGSEASGDLTIIVTGATATAKLVKLSGSTTMVPTAIDDIGVFALGMNT